MVGALLVMPGAAHTSEPVAYIPPDQIVVSAQLQADPSWPRELTLTGSGLGAHIVPVGVDPDGSLEIPADPTVLGWWSSGARPGDPAGTVVIDGHLDSDRYGIGFFANLHDLRVGNHIVLDDGEGTPTRWTVSGTGQYPSTSLPTEDLFTHDGAPRLVLITCGGHFNRATHSYPDNYVVYASPTSG